MITLTQLEYIVAIDEYRHFATAELGFRDQPGQYSETLFSTKRKKKKPLFYY